MKREDIDFDQPVELGGISGVISGGERKQDVSISAGMFNRLPEAVRIEFGDYISVLSTLSGGPSFDSEDINLRKLDKSIEDLRDTLDLYPERSLGKTSFSAEDADNHVFDVLPRSLKVRLQDYDTFFQVSENLLGLDRGAFDKDRVDQWIKELRQSRNLSEKVVTRKTDVLAKFKAISAHENFIPDAVRTHFEGGAAFPPQKKTFSIGGIIKSLLQSAAMILPEGIRSFLFRLNGGEVGTARKQAFQLESVEANDLREMKDAAIRILGLKADYLHDQKLLAWVVKQKDIAGLLGDINNNQKLTPRLAEKLLRSAIEDAGGDKGLVIQEIAVHAPALKGVVDAQGKPLSHVERLALDQMASGRLSASEQGPRITVCAPGKQGGDFFSGPEDDDEREPVDLGTGWRASAKVARGGLNNEDKPGTQSGHDAVYDASVTWGTSPARDVG